MTEEGAAKRLSPMLSCRIYGLLSAEMEPPLNRTSFCVYWFPVIRIDLTAVVETERSPKWNTCYNYAFLNNSLFACRSSIILRFTAEQTF